MNLGRLAGSVGTSIQVGDLVQDGIYTLVTGLAYEALSQRARDGR